MRIRVTYFEKDDPFRIMLPDAGVVGSVLRQLNLGDWGDDWFLLGLEEPFAYNGCQHSQILIRSRLEVNHIGGKDPAPVFVLLMPNGGELTSSTVVSREFDQAPLCLAETIQG